jgi:hypothetical protein
MWTKARRAADGNGTIGADTHRPARRAPIPTAATVADRGAAPGVRVRAGGVADCPGRGRSRRARGEARRGILPGGAYPWVAWQNTPEIAVTPGGIRPESSANQPAAAWQIPRRPPTCHAVGDGPRTCGSPRGRRIGRRAEPVPLLPRHEGGSRRETHRGPADTNGCDGDPPRTDPARPQRSRRYERPKTADTARQPGRHRTPCTDAGGCGRVHGDRRACSGYRADTNGAIGCRPRTTPRRPQDRPAAWPRRCKRHHRPLVQRPGTCRRTAAALCGRGRTACASSLH